MVIFFTSIMFSDLYLFLECIHKALYSEDLHIQFQNSVPKFVVSLNMLVMLNHFHGGFFCNHGPYKGVFKHSLPIRRTSCID